VGNDIQARRYLRRADGGRLPWLTLVFPVWVLLVTINIVVLS
jgi:hypothetical protein